MTLFNNKTSHHGPFVSLYPRSMTKETELLNLAIPAEANNAVTDISLSVSSILADDDKVDFSVVASPAFSRPFYLLVLPSPLKALQNPNPVRSALADKRNSRHILSVGDIHVLLLSTFSLPFSPCLSHSLYHGLYLNQKFFHRHFKCNQVFSHWWCYYKCG
jgi:hypothetical protein